VIENVNSKRTESPHTASSELSKENIKTDNANLQTKEIEGIKTVKNNARLSLKITGSILISILIIIVIAFSGIDFSVVLHEGLIGAIIGGVLGFVFSVLIEFIFGRKISTKVKNVILWVCVLLGYVILDTFFKF
jgi:hypothetical protein